MLYASFISLTKSDIKCTIVLHQLTQITKTQHDPCGCYAVDMATWIVIKIHMATWIVIKIHMATWIVIKIHMATWIVIKIHMATWIVMELHMACYGDPHSIMDWDPSYCSWFAAMMWCLRESYLTGLWVRNPILLPTVVFYCLWLATYGKEQEGFYCLWLGT